MHIGQCNSFIYKSDCNRLAQLISSIIWWQTLMMAIVCAFTDCIFSIMLVLAFDAFWKMIFFFLDTSKFTFVIVFYLCINIVKWKVVVKEDFKKTKGGGRKQLQKQSGTRKFEQKIVYHFLKVYFLRGKKGIQKSLKNVDILDFFYKWLISDYNINIQSTIM